MTLRAPPPERSYSAEVSARLEQTLGLDPRDTLEKLRAAQEQTAFQRRLEAKEKAELATYEARFGYPSHWEHERKALLARLANHQRDKMLRQGEKVTESYLEEYAHSHGEYRSFLDEAKREREKMEDIRARLAKIGAEIEILRGVETYYERHARLNDALVYHSGREMGLS